MNRLNRFLGITFFLFMTNLTYAQAVKGKVNEMLRDYILPVFLLFILVAAIAGIIRNFDLIEDKNNEGTRMKGFANVGVLLLYVFIGEIVLGAIIALLGSMNLQI
jgi:hypothetical protein